MPNPFGKSRKVNEPYAIYTGPNGFEWRVLKTYKISKNEKNDPYARWFVAAKSDMTFGSFEMGDTYANDVLKYGVLAECVPEWYDEYADASKVASSVKILN